MEFILEHWLSVGAGIFLLSMILYGHYRGFLRMAVSITALVFSLIIVRVAMPYVTDFLKQNTSFQELIQQSVRKGIGADETWELEIPAGQRMVIEQLNLPDPIKEVLIENNNNEVYHVLGVDKFVDYLGTYVANMVLNAIGSVLLFIVVYIGLRLLMHGLNLITRIPIISGINQIAGALLGGIQGLVILWLFCLVVKACAKTNWAISVLEQIDQSIWLSFLYHNNIFNWLLNGILKSMI